MAPIVVVVSVDWEGRSLLPENLRHMSDFRRKHPDVPFQQFLNAAYYTRANVKEDETTRAIHSTLLADDGHDLHIHAWHSLLTAAGVPVRSEPAFLAGVPPALKTPDDWEFYPAEAGYDVPLEKFEIDEIDRMIQTSQRILCDQGFRQATGFRAGGWMSGRRVQTALARNRFSMDCSAVDPSVPMRRFGDLPLCREVSKLWPGLHDCSQPYRTETPAGAIWQIPNNASLVDYTSTEELLTVFWRNVECWKSAPERNHFVSTGFHQETARKFLNRLDEIIPVIKSICRKEDVPLVFSGRPQDFLCSI